MGPNYDGTLCWSWAENEEEAEAFRVEAQSLVGQSIHQVRYITLDNQWPVSGEGPRIVSSPDEWAEPLWRHREFDIVEFGVEFITNGGASFTASWDTPGRKEGIGLRNVAAIGSAILASAHAAIWDVASEPKWQPLIGQQVKAVELRYEAWEAESEQLWCPRVDITIEKSLVSLALATSDLETGRLVPSADEIAIIFNLPGSQLFDR